MPRLSLLEYVLGGALLVALVFGGWNWYRKNVYYNQLQTRSNTVTKAADKATDNLQTSANTRATNAEKAANERADALQKQLDDLATQPPAERVVYKLRDRFVPGTCPGGTGTEAAGGEAVGLQVQDEQFLVRESARADEAVAERNDCIAQYNEARATILQFNEKYGR